MPNGNEGGEPQTFTKDDVQKLISEAVSTTEAKFQDKIKELNTESKNHRLDAKQIKSVLAEGLGLKQEELTIETLNQKIAEIAGKTQSADTLKQQVDELTKKWSDAEAKATKAEKLNQAKELAEKAGLKAKAVKLIDLNAEDLETELKKVAEEFPELKESKGVGGGGANPPDFSTASANPYKAETLNLTHQYKLERENPALAAKFKAEAGVK